MRAVEAGFTTYTLSDSSPDPVSLEPSSVKSAPSDLDPEQFRGTDFDDFWPPGGHPSEIDGRPSLETVQRTEPSGHDACGVPVEDPDVDECPGGMPARLHAQGLCGCYSGAPCGSGVWRSPDPDSTACCCPRGWPRFLEHQPGAYLTRHERAHEEPPELTLDQKLEELARMVEVITSELEDSWPRGYVRAAARSIRAAALWLRDREERVRGLSEPAWAEVHEARIGRVRRRVESRRTYRCVQCQSERPRSSDPCPSCGAELAGGA